MRLAPHLLAICAVCAISAAALLSACGGTPTGPERAATVTMRDIAFEPVTLEVRVGEPMRIELRKDGALVHDFTIETMPLTGKSTQGGISGGQHDHQAGQFALHLALEAGKRGEARFTASKAGEYDYFCTVAGHREAGMRGTIRVD